MKYLYKTFPWINAITIPVFYYKGLAPQTTIGIALGILCVFYVGYIAYHGTKAVQDK